MNVFFGLMSFASEFLHEPGMTDEPRVPDEPGVPDEPRVPDEPGVPNEPRVPDEPA